MPLKKFGQPLKEVDFLTDRQRERLLAYSIGTVEQLVGAIWANNKGVAAILETSVQQVGKIQKKLEQKMSDTMLAAFKNAPDQRKFGLGALPPQESRLIKYERKPYRPS